MQTFFKTEALVELSKMADVLEKRLQSYNELSLDQKVESGTLEQYMRPATLKVAAKLLELTEAKQIIAFGASSYDVSFHFMSVRLIALKEGQEHSVLTVSPSKVGVN